jgi:hypothetical protein
MSLSIRVHSCPFVVRPVAVSHETQSQSAGSQWEPVWATRGHPARHLGDPVRNEFQGRSGHLTSDYRAGHRFPTHRHSRYSTNCDPATYSNPNSNSTNADRHHYR